MNLDDTKACVCAGDWWRSLLRYRHFLLDFGTLFTLASGLLLILAVIQDPSGLISHETAGSVSYFYLLSALIGSAYIWWSALQGILERDFTADIPVSIATMASIAIGEYPAAAVVAVLLLFGGLLEDFVAARANQSLEALARLLPDRVTVRRDGKDQCVCLEDLKIGDLVLVRSGERIAVDGLVVQGSASVNQAAITGESVPVDKKPGDQVFAGTLNDVGALEIQVLKLGGETTIGQIRTLIEEANTQKPPIERLLNRYAKIYMPTALVAGSLLWLWSGDLMRAITMLIVFCPCVIVLATPTALVAAIGNAARKGILIKKGAAVESLSRVDTVVFDKTGTLTAGKPNLVKIRVFDGQSEKDMLQKAAVAEKFSEHPLGRAIVKATSEREMTLPDPDSFESLPGFGIKAGVDGVEVVLGRLNSLKELGISVSKDVEDEERRLQATGISVILMAIGGKAAGFLVFEDELRPQSKDAIKKLGEMGLRLVMVTGDSRAATERAARDIGISEIFAEKMPKEKVDIVRRLQSEGRKVAFVGEGVNDGPALAQADVGIALGLSGTDVAIETADVGLLSDDLSKLPYLTMVSRKAIVTIKHNLVFSIAVLLMAVILTVPGILTPVTGALLHELSSIPVIVNSMRLIAYMPKI